MGKRSTGPWPRIWETKILARDDTTFSGFLICWFGLLLGFRMDSGVNPDLRLLNPLPLIRIIIWGGVLLIMGLH